MLKVTPLLGSKPRTFPQTGILALCRGRIWASVGPSTLSGTCGPGPQGRQRSEAQFPLPKFPLAPRG